MSFDPIYIRQFSDFVYLQVEQKESHFLNLFRKEIVKGQSDSIPRIGKVNMLPRTGSPTAAAQFSDLPTSFRYLSMNAWEVVVPITKYDIDRMKLDPTNYVGQRTASAIGRQIDQVAISALLGSAATGQTGTGAAATITNTIAYNDTSFGSATNQLNVGKLLNARSTILANRQNMGLPTDDLVVILNAHQYHNLMTSDQFVSFFYNDKKPLAGETDLNYLGMKFIVSEQLPKDSTGTYDQIIVCDKAAAMIGAPSEMSPVVIEPRYDLAGKVWQVKGDLDIGAVRMEEELVVVINCAS